MRDFEEQTRHAFEAFDVVSRLKLKRGTVFMTTAFRSSGLAVIGGWIQGSFYFHWDMDLKDDEKEKGHACLFLKSEILGSSETMEAADFSTRLLIYHLPFPPVLGVTV